MPTDTIGGRDSGDLRRGRRGAPHAGAPPKTLGGSGCCRLNSVSPKRTSRPDLLCDGMRRRRQESPQLLGGHFRGHGPTAATRPPAELPPRGSPVPRRPTGDGNPTITGSGAPPARCAPLLPPTAGSGCGFCPGLLSVPRVAPQQHPLASRGPWSRPGGHVHPPLRQEQPAEPPDDEERPTRSCPSSSPGQL